jgi:hypothetical protein
VGGVEVDQGALPGGVDVGGAGGELGQPRVLDAVDLERRGAAWAAGPPGPGEGEFAGQVVGDQVVVDLRDGDDGVVQGALVHRPPSAVEALDAVGDDDMGVQIGVTGAGVPAQRVDKLLDRWEPRGRTWGN